MGIFKASDGHLNLGVAGDGLWARFCRLIGTEAWLAEPDFANEALRVKHRPRLNALVNEVFSQQTVAYWVKLLNDGGVPAGPVYSIPDLLSDEQVQHLGVLHQLQVPHNENKQMSYLTQPVKLSRTPATVRAPAPEWGEHTDDILIELGYSNDEINELRSKGVTS